MSKEKLNSAQILNQKIRGFLVEDIEELKYLKTVNKDGISIGFENTVIIPIWVAVMTLLIGFPFIFIDKDTLLFFKVLLVIYFIALILMVFVLIIFTNMLKIQNEMKLEIDILDYCIEFKEMHSGLSKEMLLKEFNTISKSEITEKPN